MMNVFRKVLVTGCATQRFPGGQANADVAQANPVHKNTYDPIATVGKKAVQHKDDATLLAMCAATFALRDARLDNRPDPAGASLFGVVVSSNFGNIDTIAKVIKAVRSGPVDNASAVDLPNTCSNVIASSLANHHGLTGPNLMLCNGATSGIDALHLASNCIRSGRAERMLVVGVEVHNAAVHSIAGEQGGRFQGAMAVVLESEPSALIRHARTYARLGDYRVQVVRGKGHATREVGVEDVAESNDAYGAEGIARLIHAIRCPARVVNRRPVRRHTIECGGRRGEDVVASLRIELVQCS